MDDTMLKIIISHVIDEEEREEEIINLMIKVKKRKVRHDIFTHRRTEGLSKNLISQHLIDDETKFKNYFRIIKRQFDFVLSEIRNSFKYFFNTEGQI